MRVLRRLATSSVTSFSERPEGPRAPVSSPAGPGSMTTTKADCGGGWPEGAVPPPDAGEEGGSARPGAGWPPEGAGAVGAAAPRPAPPGAGPGGMPPPGDGTVTEID